MGNLPLSTGLFRTEATPSNQVCSGRFIARRIRNGITYYYSPVTGAGRQTACPAKDLQTSTAVCPTLSHSPSDRPLGDSSSSSSAEASSAQLLSDSPSHTPASPTPRPLVVFFSWLGAHGGPVAKYRDLYLDRGMDVLLVQSSVMHFLWPRWGLDYGLEALKVLEEPQFSGRAVLVHAASIGGYTFTQILTHISQGPKKHADLAQRVVGHIYDSLVVGTLEHMAIGLGRTLAPRLESLIRTTAMLYFWLFKTHTADYYENSVHVFHNSPITTPALFFYSENDVMCNPVALEKVMDCWKKRGVAVESRKWKESIHAAHMRCHPEEYLSTLQRFLNSLPISSKVLGK